MKNLNILGKLFYCLLFFSFLFLVANAGTFGILFYLMFGITGKTAIFWGFFSFIASAFSFVGLLRLENI
jgi:hypothetical protein